MSINRGPGPYVFRLHEQNYHKMGSLLPSLGEQPRFTQLYIYDTENEVSNRINSVTNESTTDLDPEIVEGLAKMLYENNELAKVFRMEREIFVEDDMTNVRVRLIGTCSKDGRQYNLPTTQELAAVIIGSGDTEKNCRDVIIEERGYGL